LDPNEQIILGNFYNSLTSKITLTWNLESDLCAQTGVVCDTSNPQRVIELYFLLLLFISPLKQVKQIS